MVVKKFPIHPKPDQYQEILFVNPTDKPIIGKFLQ